MIAGAAGVAAAPAGATGGRLFVSPAGHNSDHCGRETRPCRTIGQAVTNATDGAIIVVEPGTYHEDVMLAKPLTLVGHHATIDAKNLVNGIVIGPGADHSTVDGFHVRNEIGEGILATQVDGVTIRRNVVAHNDKGATTPSTYPPCQAQGQIPGDCGEALHLQATTNSTVARNIVSRNVGGILVSDDIAPTHGNVIAHNTITDNALDCGITIPSHTPAGVYDNVVEWNLSANNGGAGILVATAAPGSAAHDNVIRHNQIVGNGEGGVQLHSHTPNQNLDNNVITDNFIGKNNTAGDPDSGDMKTTGIIVFSAVVPVNGTVVHGNTIANDHFGIWLSPNVSTAGFGVNKFFHVNTHIFQ
jgi:hypothetical protein